MRRKIRKWLTSMRNAHYARFPSLTHVMIDPPRLPTMRWEPSCRLSDQFLNRMCAAFRAAQPPSADEDIWTDIADRSSLLRHALHRSDLPGLRAHLTDLFAQETLLGMAHATLFLTRKSPYGQDYFVDRCRDALFSLAEALAVRGVMSNQQTPWPIYARTLNADLSPLAADVERALGHSLTPTTFGGPPVAIAGRHELNPDFIRHAYVMHRVEQLGVARDAPILEIGGGFGCVARYAYLRGYRDYTIIDLPFVNAIQAAFLADALGEDAVSLHGEAVSAPIRLIPSTAKDMLAPTYSLALNMDSLPEIAEAATYLELIAERASLFLSVNQEAGREWHGFKQHFLPAMIDEMGGFRRLSRHPYWMEQGYTEELYAVRQRSPELRVTGAE